MSGASKLSAFELNRVFVKALGDLVDGDDLTDRSAKPLEIDVQSVLPSPIRAYLFTLTFSVAERQQGAYRSQLILPGHSRRGDRVHLNFEGSAFVVIGGYEPNLDVFCFWDAGLHDRGGIPYSKGVQVADVTLYSAAHDGLAEQDRNLRPQGSPTVERVVAARSDRLVDALRRRWDLDTERLIEEYQ